MNDQAEEPQPAGLRVQDIAFILFRHKWKILISFALGVLAAGAVKFLDKPGYVARAKLLVRYVVNTTVREPMGSDREIERTDSGGVNIINSELEILTSRDLALAVADALGPSVLSHPGQETNRNRLAGRVASGLQAEAPKRGNVIVLTYEDEDPAVAGQVLTELIQRYLAKHLEVRRSGPGFEVLTRQTEEMRARLEETESELGRLKSEAKVVTLETTRAQLAQQMTKIRDDLLTTQAALAEQQARVHELQRVANPTAVSSATNGPPPADQKVVERYRELVAQLSRLRQLRADQLRTYMMDHPLVRPYTQQIEEADTERRALEKEYPALVLVAAPTTGTGAAPAADLAGENARVVAYEARIRELTNQLAKVMAASEAVDGVEARITQLERQRDLERTNLYYFSAKLEQSRFDQTLDPRGAPNINVIQRPTIGPADSSKILKIAMGLLAVGALGGIGLALLIELVLDQRVKRPSEVETRLNVPLILSVPQMDGVGMVDLTTGQLALPAKTEPERPVPILPSLFTPTGPNGDEPEPAKRPGVAALPALAQGSTAPWEVQHVLRPYFEALRDRLLLFFQLKAPDRKPKLVAVTACAPGAGSSTMATGLAAALSETGEGKVLLVDMNLGRGAVHPFLRGRPECTLSQVLEPHRREYGQVNDNLYIASAGPAEGERARPLPRQFHALMPKMRASDYDYIIFDMPPLNQTSVTIALAASMDEVLLVVEGEKTRREELKRAYAHLRQYNTNVNGIFNKSRSYGPAWLLADA